MTILSLAQELVQLEARRAEILAALHAATAPDTALQSPSTALQFDRGVVSEAVRQALAKQPSGMSLAALATATGFPQRTISGVLSRLKRQGQAQAISRGVWGPGTL